MTSSWTALAGCPDAADYLTSSATKPRRQPDGGRSSEPRIQAVCPSHTQANAPARLGPRRPTVAVVCTHSLVESPRRARTSICLQDWTTSALAARTERLDVG